VSIPRRQYLALQEQIRFLESQVERKDCEIRALREQLAAMSAVGNGVSVPQVGTRTRTHTQAET
jgi:hypothetical protein